MQVTLTHNSELRLRKVDALYRISGVSYPVSGDIHYPSIGEEVEVAKHQPVFLDRDYGTAIERLRSAMAIRNFKRTGEAKDLTKAINALNQEMLF